MQVPWVPLGLITGFVMALLMASHWAPWPQRLPRLVAYGVGVSILMIGYTTLCLLYRWYAELLAMWVIVIAGGVTVAMCWGIDHIAGLVKRVVIAERDVDAQE